MTESVWFRPNNLDVLMLRGQIANKVYATVAGYKSLPLFIDIDFGVLSPQYTQEHVWKELECREPWVKSQLLSV